MKNILLSLILSLSTLGAVSAAPETPTEVEAPQQDDFRSITQLLLKWGYFRDHKMWEELQDTFHPGGQINVTWYTGDIEGFVQGSIKMAKSGVKSMHVMYPSIVEIQGDRAIAITPTTISGRKEGDGPALDLTSAAQFFDFLEKKDNKWRISRRHAIYQKDRMDSLEPSFTFWLMSFFIDTDDYPSEYKYLAFGLEQGGLKIQPGQIVDNSDQSRALYREGKDWLAQEHP